MSSLEVVAHGGRTEVLQVTGLEFDKLFDCKRVTAPYKYPRIIEFATELPKTISGKIRRVQIRESDARSAQQDG